MRRFLLLSLLLSAACATKPGRRVQTRLVTDEADAVLAILNKRASGQPIADADWQWIFASEGYVRLKKRELSMKRAFDDQAFRDFVMTDALLARRGELSRTLAEWSKADLSDAARRALAYLPRGTTIRASVYPVIKPRENSFVFELGTDPAIFKYVDPQPRAAFEQTMSHEMHHVGYAAACPPLAVAAEMEKLPKEKQAIGKWIGAFGEGLATLAAAGGPANDPQAHGERADLPKVWRDEMAKYDRNFRSVEAFFLDVVAGKLSEDDENTRGFEFFGLLGPWYTVGLSDGGHHRERAWPRGAHRRLLRPAQAPRHVQPRGREIRRRAAAVG